MSQKSPVSSKKRDPLTLSQIQKRLEILWPEKEVQIISLLPRTPGKKIRGIFLDIDSGEWECSVDAILNQKQRHPATRAIRSSTKKILNAESLHDRLEIVHNGLVKIDLSTYVKSSSKAKFIDIDYGEWEAPVYSVLQGHGHPNRNKGACHEIKYTIEDMPVFDICKDFNLNYTRVKYLFRKYEAPASIEELKTLLEKTDMNYLETTAEKLLHGYTRCNKQILSSRDFRPDFVNLEKKIAINIDGLYWHSEIKFQNHQHHYEMRLAYESEGWRLISFYEDEILYSPLKVESIARNAIGLSKKIFARKTEKRSITASMAKEFLSENHLMNYYGGGPVGLFHENTLVGVMTFKKSPKGTEISRCCFKNGIQVIGGFSKLISHISGTVFSFCDLRYGTGISYETCGFRKDSESVSFQWTNSKLRKHRLFIRAKNGKTQSQIAEELRYYRIFDYGQRKYIKTSNELRTVNINNT